MKSLYIRYNVNSKREAKMDTKTEQVVLRGKTRHGKNRLNQHGKAWWVCEVRNDKLLLKSFDRTDKGVHDLRWVQVKDDPNFEIVDTITDDEINQRLALMEQAEINAGRF